MFDVYLISNGHKVHIASFAVNDMAIWFIRHYPINTDDSLQIIHDMEGF